MFRRGFLVASLVLLFVLSNGFNVVQASSYSGTLQITCTDAFDFGPGVVTLDRNNSTVGNEDFRILATDGAGIVLRDFYNSLPLGDYVFGDLVFTTPPTANPITVSFISVAENGFLQQVVFTATGTCSDLVFQGVPIPTGFVLHTIGCDTPVYDTPGGSPVGDNAVTNGQTWFVSPTPVQGTDGQSWTEIFVSGIHDAFVPTSCVH